MIDAIFHFYWFEALNQGSDRVDETAYSGDVVIMYLFSPVWLFTGEMVKLKLLIVSVLLATAFSLAAILWDLHPAFAVLPLTGAVALAFMMPRCNRGRLNIISGIGVGVLLSDQSGMVLDCNSECHEILDMDSDKLLDSWQWLEHIDRHDRFRLQVALKSDQQAETAVVPSEFEVLLRGKSGESRNLLVKIVIQNDTDLRLVSLTDITERHRVMDILHQREELMDCVVETIGDGLAAFDRDLHLTHWNPAMEKFTGITHDRLMLADDPFDVFDLGMPLGRSCLEDALAGERIEQEIELISRDNGEPVTVFMMILPIRSPRGDVTGVIAVLRDVSEVKKAREEILKAKEIAESTSHAKSEFLANVSHELRTPMNGVIGLLNLVLDEELGESQRQWITSAVDAATSLTKVINNILEYAKMDTGLGSVSEQEMSPQACARDALQAIGPLAAAKGIRTFLDCGDDVPGRLVGNASQLRQVLQHLLNNAVKFSDDGDIRVVISKGQSSGGKLELGFDVSDNGVGVPESRRQEIFDAFTQADGSSTRRYSGTGLGLAISKRIVRQMGGTITVRDNVQKGSVFSFTASFGLPGAAGDNGNECISSETVVIDLKACIARLGGDMELVGEIAELFIAESPEQLDSIAKAIEAGDSESAATAAHAFKGSVGNFQVVSLMDSSKCLESYLREGNLDAASGELMRLRAMTTQLLDSLGQLTV